jgi:hypothetical protein
VGCAFIEPKKRTAQELRCDIVDFACRASSGASLQRADIDRDPVANGSAMVA